METPSFDLHELLQRIWLEVHAAWRYRWYALGIAWCIAIVGAVLVFGIPNRYQTTAQVYADTAALTNPLLSGVAVQPDVKSRLEVITQTLLSRPHLEKVADETNLSLRATTAAQKSRLLDRLGKMVKVRSTRTEGLYKISYTDTDPHMTQKVVQAFLQILMHETLGSDGTSDQTAQSFLQQQVDLYGDRLNKAQQQLADFTKAHVGNLPDASGGGYAARLQGAEVGLQSLQGQYKVAMAKHAAITGQMRGMATDPDSTGIDPQVRQINQQIATYQDKLNELLLKYTDAYPDVVATRRMIKQLETRRNALRKQTSDTSLAGLATDNPVYQQRQTNLYDAQTGMQALATNIAVQKQLIASLKARVAQSAQVKATLQKLTRNYNTTKQMYDGLLLRLNTAQISQAATHSGNNLKFRVVDPPTVPVLPVSPKRGALLLLVFVFAVGMGCAFAYFLHLIRPVFLNLQDLRALGGHPVIGAFQLVESPARLLRKRRQIIGFCAGVGLLAVALVVGFAFNGLLAGMVQHVFVAGVA